MQTRQLIMVAIATFGLHAGAFADTLVIDSVRASQQAGAERPSKGQSMAAVERQFGTPAQVVPAVGQPPITRWVYDGFTVFFEDSTVLHSVAHR